MFRYDNNNNMSFIFEKIPRDLKKKIYDNEINRISYEEDKRKIQSFLKQNPILSNLKKEDI